MFGDKLVSFRTAVNGPETLSQETIGKIGYKKSASPNDFVNKQARVQNYTITYLLADADPWLLSHSEVRWPV